MSVFPRFLEYFALSGLGVCAALLTGIYLWRLSGRARIYARRYGIIGLLAAAFFGFAAITEGPPDEDYKAAVQEELDGEGETNAVYGAMLCYSPRRALSAPSPAPTTEMDLSPRLVYVATNEVDYTMPTNAVEYAPWRLRGAAEDWFKLGLEGGSDWWRFPKGTNEYSAFRVFTDGTIRPKLHSTNDTISAVGTAMSAIPNLSRFWYSVGTNDSRILTWENFALGRVANQVSSALPPSLSVSAQIELFPSGDYIVRSNNVERLYRFIDPFDVPEEEWGQSDADKAYIDAMVGTNLENGYYKLTVTVPPSVGRRTLITVGDQQLVADKPGEYAFLLAKGIKYNLDLLPYNPDIRYDAVDDIVPPMMLMQGTDPERGMQSGHWTTDEGHTELVIPNPMVPFAPSAYILWAPRLSVTPGNWDPSENDPSETFTAVLSDIPFYAWPTNCWRTTDSSVVSISSPRQMTTAMECHYPKADETSCGLSLDVGFLDSVMHVEFVRDAPGDGDGRPAPSFTIPNTFFVNNDDDNDDGLADGDHPYLASYNDDDFVEVEIAAPEDAPGTVRIEGVAGYDGGFTGEDEMAFLDDRGNRPLGDGTSFTSYGWDSFALYLNPRSRSSSYRDVSIKATFEPDEGQAWSSTARFTIVEPVVEPICTETTNVFENGRMRNLTVNPCGVAIGRNAYFRIAVEPSDYPNSMIVWSVTDDSTGSVSFVGGNTGRSVTVRGVSPGDVTLKIQIGDCQSAPPTFTLRVVEPKTVRLSAWIVANLEGETPVDAAKIREMINEAEDIFAQVGVSFDIGDRISVTNIAEAYNVLWENGTDDVWDFDRLVATHSGTGGLECYFVNTIISSGRNKIVGGHSNSGIVLAASASAVTFAHEIGHGFGMKDVYRIAEQNRALFGAACCAWNIDDWNGGCVGRHSPGTRYYEYGIRQEALIRRMLMDGLSIGEVEGRDITYGSIYGFDKDGFEEYRSCGYFNNSLKVEFPVHQ